MLPGNYLIWLGVIFTAFWGGWETQGWHRDSLEKDRAEANLEAQRIAGRARTAAEARVVTAQNAAAARAANDRADAADARTELDRVRSLSDAAVTAAEQSHAACVDRATALKVVFSQCAGRYAELGEKADRHVSDLKTLSDSWPE